MNNNKLAEKTKKLKGIMAKYQKGMADIKRELTSAISDYQKALTEEKLKELKAEIFKLDESAKR